ncbi:DUF3397 family protein [Brevibacillus fulvus]|uniref:Heme/copper-type cytochrome/quinol oxidase subunit 2 n=1 Tax=Brevibacillus fulvus TaxID=1125967 RepID=A0A939BU96_9BACL|nr:DUF3397 family protein [Brevibacillus fulvus]MBM7589306.1 heme/copper-type cytochrome/quinol oxidase subunit 2 [Brevibacillus fulvus]
MTVLANIWLFIWGVLTVIPFVGFAIVYTSYFLWKKDHRRALGWSINITNLLLIHAIIVAYEEIWPKALSAWFWIISIIFVLFFLLASLQFRIRKKISLQKLGTSTSRITFLLFGLIYLVLFTTGVVKMMQLG